jgi:hypothetical protein
MLAWTAKLDRHPAEAVLDHERAKGMITQAPLRARLGAQ